MSGSINTQQINLTKLNELEEGEISDSYINKQEILKLIDCKKKNIVQKITPLTNIITISNQSQSSVHSVSSNISNDFEEEIENKTCESVDEEEEEIGFFHKMNKKQIVPQKSKKENEFLISKRKRSEAVENQSNIEPKMIQNDKRGNKWENQNKMKQNRNQNSIEDLTKKPNRVKKPEFKPKLVCQYYVNGACNKGSECTFSHDAPQVKKNDMCKYFLSGNCMKGNECLFSHNLESEPCKYFHAMGCCINGETCKFSHQRLSEKEIFAFIGQNEDFIFHLFRTMGRTNMDDYLQKFLESKKNHTVVEETKNMTLPSNMMLNIRPPQNEQIPQMPMSLPKPGMPPKMHFIPRQMPPMMTPNQISQIIAQNPALLMQFMRNPLVMQPMMNPQPTMAPLETSKEVIFNANNAASKSLNMINLINEVNPFQRPPITRHQLNPPLQQPQQKNEVVTLTNTSEEEEEASNNFPIVKPYFESNKSIINDEKPRDPRKKNIKKK